MRMKAIDKTHPIFASEDYRNDRVPFSLMELIKQHPMLLESDEKDCILGMIAPQMPIWVWTSDGILEASITALCGYFYSRFHDGDSVQYVAKPSIARALAKPFLENLHAEEHRVEQESFECPQVVPHKNRDVVIEKPTAADVEDIAVCMANFEKDCFGVETEPRSLLDSARNKLDNPYFFVIKQNQTVVATAQSSRETETHMAINQVYTKPEFRGRGFAAALVAYISELIFQKGKIPSLYTDLANPSSNKAYKNVGFVERGRVDEITLTWNRG